METMANSFGAKHNCIVQVLDTQLMRFSCVEETGHSVWVGFTSHDCLFGCEDLFGEFANLWREVLFVDHVEA